MRYFDHNATSPLCPTARQAWLDAVERLPANPSSPHRPGARAETALGDARESAAAWLGASPFDVVWTSGATEAANAVMHHAARESTGEVWISAIEHPCMIAAADRWFDTRVVRIPVTPDGVTDLNWLAGHLQHRRPALVAIMAANNETGVLQPWSDALAICHDYGVPFACDAAQWLGKLPAAGLGQADFVIGSAHKFGGPAGTGLMKVPPKFRPYLVGGPQEDGRRAGTENVAGILSMRTAWADRERQIDEGGIGERKPWQDRFIAGLQSILPDTEILGRRVSRLWNTVSFLIRPMAQSRRRWVVRLDKLGFAVSTGSACASGKEQPSHVLLAMGYDPAKVGQMLRVSSGWETSEDDWHALLDAIKMCARER
jgi:cysteine desulfurase